MVESETEPGTTKDVGDENMVTLIRMCGSRFQGTYKKLNECTRACQKKVVEQQLAIIDNICIIHQEKALVQAYLPYVMKQACGFHMTSFSP